MSKSVLIRRTSLGKLIIRLWMAIVILLIPVSSYSLPYQSPRTQNVEQTNVPDYINQAEVGVKKYYPQYEEYFKGIIKEIKWLWGYGEYLINKEINRKLILLWEGLNEKEIVTSILISLERITEKNEFNTKNWISKNSIEYEIWKQVTEWFYYTFIWETKKIEWFRNEMELLYWKLKVQWTIEIGKEYIEISEKYMKLLKGWLLNYWELRREKTIQDWVMNYIEILKRSNRTPSKIGQIYIDEYNKINKK